MLIRHRKLCVRFRSLSSAHETAERCCRGALSAIVLLTMFVLAPGCSSSPAKPAAAGTSSSAPTTTARPAASPDVESIEDWTYDGDKGLIIRTPHFRIYTTQTEPILITRLPGFLEAAMNHYRTALPSAAANAAGGTMQPLPPPAIKLDTFVMRTRMQWERLTKQLLADKSGPYLRIPRGGFAYGGRALLFDIGTQDTMAILAHEGWHQYIQRAFAQPLPIWLDEGIASYMEGHRWSAPDGDRGSQAVFLPWANVERFDALRDAAARNELLSLSALLEAAPANLIGPGGDAGDALTYYAQVWALTHFLVEGAHGRYAAPLNKLLSDAASGNIVRSVVAVFGPDGARGLASRRGPTVFLAYFNRDLAEVESEYRAFIDQLVQPGSRGPIVEGKSPLINR